MTDLKVVQAKTNVVLHTTSSSTFTEIDDVDVVSILPRGNKENSGTKRSLEGTVISIDMSSLAIIHTCSRCKATVEIESGFYCCTSCNMMGTMESVMTKQPKIGFCFKDLKNIKHDLCAEASILEDFTGHTVLNKVKLAMHLCKMPPFIININNNEVTAMELKNKSDFEDFEQHFH